MTSDDHSIESLWMSVYVTRCAKGTINKCLKVSWLQSLWTKLV